VGVVTIDEPLPAPWSAARLGCIWTSVGAWVVFWINYLTAGSTRTADAALAVSFLAVLAVLPVTLLGRSKLKHLNELAKEKERLQLDR